MAATGFSASGSVRLHRPPPVEKAMRLERDAGVIRVLDDTDIVLEAHPSAVEVVRAPLDRSVAETILERGPAPVDPDHPAPDCFVCGHRVDGLRLSPRHLDGTSIWATTWSPDLSMSQDGSTVEERIIWGALDCPAGFAVTRYGVEQADFFPALTRFDVTITHPVPVGRAVVVAGWFISEDPKRTHGGTAIVDDQGTVLASAFASHARVPRSFANT